MDVPLITDFQQLGFPLEVIIVFVNLNNIVMKPVHSLHTA